MAHSCCTDILPKDTGQWRLKGLEWPPFGYKKKERREWPCVYTDLLWECWLTRTGNSGFIGIAALGGQGDRVVALFNRHLQVLRATPDA